MKAAGTFKKGTNAGTAKCTSCGQTRQRANIAMQTEPNGDGLCNECFNMAGDENMVADGNMTCVEFQAIYGQHSDYCDCSVEAMVEELITSTEPVAFVDEAERELTAEEVYARTHCECGCGGSPKGKRSRFLPGHDAKAASLARTLSGLGLSRKMVGID